MGIFAPLKKSFDKLQSELDGIGKQVVEAKEREIVEFFQDNQIGMGLKVGSGDGLRYIRMRGSNRTGYGRTTEDFWRISSDYKPDYDKSAGNPYYMEWSGDFFRSMRAKYLKGFKYEITSSDGKLSKLFYSFGDDLLEIGNITNKEIVRTILAPDIDREIIKRINTSLV